jgi:protein required for attachment to host cells
VAQGRDARGSRIADGIAAASDEFTLAASSKETEMKIKAGEWVVVFDGGKALLLQNAGDDLYPNLETREVHDHANPKASDQGSDRPGRVHESASAGRSSMEQTDWHEANERKFIAGLADRLDKAVRTAKISQMIVVAPPHALGVLREHYSDAVRGAVKAELAKDYVKKPIHEIETLLGSIEA